MKQWHRLEADDLVAMHGELIAEFGGPAGLRDRALLESAAARPKHLATYERPSAFELAAAYAFGLARNHPFILIRKAREEGPQVITVHGEDAAVIVSAEQYGKLRRRKGSLIAFFRKSPLVVVGLTLTRRDTGRQVDL